MTPFVFLATPSFERRPCIEYHLSMLQTIKELNAAGIRSEVSLLGGFPYISHVRNRLVSHFLTDFPDATDFMFIDDDVGWPAHKVVEFVQRPEDVVFGVYPKKQDALSFPVSLELDSAYQFIEKNGLYLANLVPTGFMRIKRHVLEKMAMRSSRYYTESADGRQLLQWSIFEAKFVDPGIETLREKELEKLSFGELLLYLRRAIGITPCPDIGKWWGEDFWFAERWRQMGGTSWVDPEISFIHRGSKAWSATFGDSLRTMIQRMKETAS